MCFSSFSTAVFDELPYCVLEVVVRGHTLRVLCRSPSYSSCVDVVGRRSVVWYSLPGCQSLFQARVRRRGDLQHLLYASIFAQPVSIGKGSRGNN